MNISKQLLCVSAVVASSLYGHNAVNMSFEDFGDFTATEYNDISREVDQKTLEHAYKPVCNALRSGSEAVVYYTSSLSRQAHDLVMGKEKSTKKQQTTQTVTQPVESLPSVGPVAQQEKQPVTNSNQELTQEKEVLSIPEVLVLQTTERNDFLAEKELNMAKDEPTNEMVRNASPDRERKRHYWPLCVILE